MTARRTACAIALLAAVASCGGSRPAAAPQRIRSFAASDTPVTTTGVTPADGGWRIERVAPGTVPLFEIENPGIEYTTLTYRAHLRSEGVQGKAYLEMWVRVPGRGEFFSRGLAQPIQGTQGWASYEIPFFLNEKGVRPDLVKLNVAFEGSGTVWIKDVELLHTPMS